MEEEEEQWGEEEGYEEEEAYYDEEGVEYYYEYEEGGEEGAVVAEAPAAEDEEDEESKPKVKLTEEEEIAMLESKGWVNTSKIKGPPSRLAPRPPPVMEKMAAGKKDTWENVKSDRNWKDDVDLSSPNSPGMTMRKKPVEVTVPAAVAKRYEVKERLGARVFAAVELASGELVALKVVREPTALAALLGRLASVAGATRLRGEELGTLVLELRAGGSLANHLPRCAASFSERDAARVLRDVLRVLADVHEAGVLHLDICPGHVMRDGPESPWGLEGFSLARDESSAAKTPVNGGAVHYQAPEIVFFSGCGRASDVWSVGVLAHLLVCGALPFPEQHVAKLKVSIKKGLLALPAFVSPEARLFVSALLASDPAQRPSARDALQMPFIVSPPDSPPHPDVVKGLEKLK